MKNCERFNNKEEAAMAFNEAKRLFIPQGLLWHLAPFLDWLFEDVNEEGGAK